MKSLFLLLPLALSTPALADPLGDVAASLKATTSRSANFTQTGGVANAASVDINSRGGGGGGLVGCWLRCYYGGGDATGEGGECQQDNKGC